jgi:dihydrofolate reductase
MFRRSGPTTIADINRTAPRASSQEENQMTSHTDSNRRTVVGNISLSLDGRVHGLGGDHDMGWIVPHAVTDAARDLMVRLSSTATTVVLGRKNYEGFGGHWPTVARDPDAEPRDRATGQWLDAVEKVVVSTTLTGAEWSNSRVVNADPAAVVEELRSQPGGDIVVLNSSSVIRSLLRAGQLDRLIVTLCPEIVGGGARLLEDGLPTSSWRLLDLASSDTGALCLTYERIPATS